MDWGLLAAISKLDRFDASWSAIERRAGQSLKQLKAIATSHPGCKSGLIAERLGIPLQTVERILTAMLAQKLLEKHGSGPGTSYTAG